MKNLQATLSSYSAQTFDNLYRWKRKVKTNYSIDLLY